ncbi:MAG: type I-F CRISPR-associated protein Csy1 [Gammaproteobacteria bacterium]|nr:type I-F CRISPR-associated protein Csy1 [Gammaproteobacteria bacterium]MBQ0774406.1 type I-F CRISPR-associated protein Csy1 [Gammaproteobacteria bacterium]
MDSSSSSSTQGLRAAMEQFLGERLQRKLEKLAEDDPKRESLQAQFQFSTWVASAAARASKIQLATHSLKPIHSKAKGTNLYVLPADARFAGLVGSGVLGNAFSHDVVCDDAKHLDVYKFLKVEYNGQSILERALQGDGCLVSALSDDAVQAQEWVSAFAGLVQPRDGAASHTRAKQVYWLVGDDPSRDDHYHLLAPLYATSLAHYVYLSINNDRFGELSEEARKARREKKPSDQGYRDHPNLAIQKLGGSNTQNISQLNSERGGTNYLLASLPPVWESTAVSTPNSDSVFPRFGRRKNVRELIGNLRGFLNAGPDPVLATRQRRDSYLDALIDELVLFASELSMLEPGWSAKPECRLNEAEAFWLDPYRGDHDEAFQAKRDSEQWTADVRHRFANWLNHALQRGLPVGDVEYQYWSNYLKKKLNALTEVLVYA